MSAPAPSSSSIVDPANFAVVNQINVALIVDTESVVKAYPKPSQNPSNATAIGHDHEFLIVTNSPQVDKQGTADVSFTARIGDEVSFFGVSTHGNAQDAIILYDITPVGEKNVFNDFVLNVLDRNGVQPDPAHSKDHGIPARHVPLTYNTIDSKIRQKGRESFWVHFALYKLNENQDDQVLVGYYKFDPTVTVN
eukprot:TRINITY_DN6585_c0_g1_i2.p1 TRINITY_DN6585_c0_g1~~TRINITY_DN6585_c0_g1_i2.p1  ORF type:complete len:194 (+),score=72.68 TRINITY_DN6585_c0_g1_i2:133-714(+)